MPKLEDIKFGHCNIKNLAYWINERHNIYLRKFYKHPKPWTEDVILQQYKFTNVFRQLDKGTVALQEMLNKKSLLKLATKQEQKALIFFNIYWYRLFNWYEHAQNLGFVVSYEEVEKYIKERYKNNQRIFTGAWMTHGHFCEPKYITYLRGCKECWDRRFEFVDFIRHTNSIEWITYELRNLYCIGKFLSYEIACDLRFTKLLENATDKLTWANMGPGAQRGLKRLGLPFGNQQQGLVSMQLLYRQLTKSKNLLETHILNAEVPFELREVEHSLCEMDKYMRVKMGEGRPRSKYNGIA